MTLLVGIVCDGGAVIAADRQASHGVFGNITVGHQVSKINAIGGNTLFASSGPVGLNQQLANVVQGELHQFKNRNYAGVATLLQKKVREIIDPALQTAGHAARVIGQAAQSDVLCSSLLATEFKDGLQLIEISAQGGFECLTPQLPYVCQVAENKMPILSSRLYGRFISTPVDRTSVKPCWRPIGPSRSQSTLSPPV
jgi:20S proteasome alpha/beta subunit